MSTTYIFAIGGTGSRVLRSFSMLLASGCTNTSVDTEVVPIIFDYDLTNGDLVQKTVPVLKNYAKIHDAVYQQNDTNKEMFFCSKLTPIRRKTVAMGPNVNNLQFNPDAESGEFAAWVDTNNIPNTFKDYLGYEQMTGDYWPTHQLLDALYNNSNALDPATEINMDFTVGFKGCPNIGCLVAEHFTQTPEYTHFTRVFNQNAGDRIIIVGSVFGGTGASGIPILLNALRHDIGWDAKISVLAMAPYFSINTRNGGVINSKTFIAKFRAAMTAYSLADNVNDKATRIYYVGDNDMAVPFNYCDGGTNQQNPAVFAELVGAMCCLNFITTNAGDIINAFPAVAYEMGMKGNSPISNVNNPIVDGTTMVIGWNNFFDNSVNDYLVPLRRLALFAKFCNEYLHDGIPNNETWYHSSTGIKFEQTFIKDLKQFYTLYKDWLDELRSDHRPLQIINLAVGTDDYKDFLDGYTLEERGVFNRIKWHITNELIADEMTKSFSAKTAANAGIDQKRTTFLYMSCADAAVRSVDNQIKDHINNN